MLTIGLIVNVETIETLYSYFFAALKDTVKQRGHGGQKVLAIDAGISDALLSQILSRKSRKQASLRTQKALAKACGFDSYENFLAHGRRLLKGEPAESEQPSPVEPTSELRRVSDRTGEGDTREGVLDLFQNKEKAREAVLLLAGIERTDREQYAEVIGYIRGTANSLDIKKSA